MIIFLSSTETPYIRTPCVATIIVVATDATSWKVLAAAAPTFQALYARRFLAFRPEQVEEQGSTKEQR
jgi:hypothetical protein